MKISFGQDRSPWSGGRGFIEVFRTYVYDADTLTSMAMDETAVRIDAHSDPRMNVYVFRRRDTRRSAP